MLSFSKMLEERNVKFYMNNGVTEIRGENGKVTLKKHVIEGFGCNDLITMLLLMLIL